jgi:2-polyprenyl-3-methyl-5-hydroxy-6-metoxy-1,4-benzoquinol methylase
MSDPMTSDQANAATRAAWNANAAFWDERMGLAGNGFVNKLIWPATGRLLEVRPGQRVLDIACGNGLYANRLAALGAEVVAFDFAAEMIEQARKHVTEHAGRITYQVLDATDEAALLALGEGQFDAAVCLMALMDMANIEPLLRTLPRLLRSRGRFVFAVTHPCFNNTNASHIAEMSDQAGTIVTTYAVKVSGYITPATARGAAIAGQPEPQLYFDRPLSVLLGACFQAGFVLDALEEPTFPPDDPAGKNPLSWNGNYSEIPPVLIARLRVM